jgi:hypothetical protein
MADDLKNRGAQDRSRVNIHEDYEVQYWTKKWGEGAARRCRSEGRRVG